MVKKCRDAALSESSNGTGERIAKLALKVVRANSIKTV